MKLPKVPRGPPKRPLKVTPPFSARAPRVSPIPQQPPKTHIPKQSVNPIVPKPPTDTSIPPPTSNPTPLEEKEYLNGLTEDEHDALGERTATRKQERIKRWQRSALTVMGLSAFGIGMYLTTMYISLTSEPRLEDMPNDISAVFDEEAEVYDEKVGMAETMLGLTSRRRAITERVKGHVLEVAVGTGRNFSFYPIKNCDTVTLLDSSVNMVAVAKRKWKDEQPEYFHRVFFKHQSALDPITPPYGAQDGYDTVLQTMGLCSTPEPERLLQNLEASTKEDGQILLLEHGKSHYEWLNKLLDKSAANHAKEHGCYWNKDIGKIVEDSGLEVVEIKRYNFGTTWWVELKPRKGMRKAIEVAQPVAPVSPDVPQKPWWSFWR
ncbi:S-adenosyl-L-methionine-dependent methyltransferase [Lophiostoma macrostomum CBS 122681]|uniref:S-adenosyl-L-methionine-dependent methyltransferase n=1 Tax=Lophiostoma macrostomum CBS 122681 TaxID=1314788 RepID=A0A6A6TKK3_9PLEO|nr:S-adenosyl-L-methionine-dependent methyltransferase [Lophiostoma macrostomum CBS 122681]